MNGWKQAVEYVSRYVGRWNRAGAAIFVLTAVSTAIAIEPSTRPAEKKSTQAQVEIHIPSISGLIGAAKRSHSAQLAAALTGLVAPPRGESDEDFDFDSLLSIVTDVSGWPDTPLSMAVYAQDRDGRPRWSVRTGWEFEDFRARIERLVATEAVQRLAKDLRIVESESGLLKLELADQVLAYFRGSTAGSWIVSTSDLKPPEKVFGEKSDAREGASGKRSLLYCRLNLDAGDEEEKSLGPLGQLSMFSDVRYACSLTQDGQWSERLNLRWNPLLGMALKSALKKASRPLDCPRDALCSAVVHISMGEGLADAVAGLSPGTIGSRVGSEMAISVLPGSGFLPVPDLVYQFHAKSPDAIESAMRKELKKHARQRAADDKPPLWREEQFDGQTVFWKDDYAEVSAGITFVSYRTAVIVLQAETASADARSSLVIVETPTPVEEFVERWKNLRERGDAWVKLPADNKSSWEARVRWEGLYAILGPALEVVGSLNAEATSVDAFEKLAAHLPDSTINLKIEYAGLDVRHTGPVPFGAVYVPTVTAVSIADTGAAYSESQRERVACRNLRVLHHHAKLFRKDYGRWPAGVAELDGYVDFQSHPELLNLRRKDDGFAAGLVSMFTSRKPKVRLEDGDAVVDDSLYIIEGEGDDWRLSYRANQFKAYDTIAIDAEGEIHRVAKAEQS